MLFRSLTAMGDIGCYTLGAGAPLSAIDTTLCMGCLLYTSHPSPKQVFDVLVPQYIIGLVYGALIKAFASENSARMVAMDSSSKNAEEMLGKLNIELNRARQQAITMEITEIVGAIEALT